MIRWNSIISPTYVDGPGKRAALFVQGCLIRCKDCQNRDLWPARGGWLSEPEQLAKVLINTDLPITITGGEPFDQARALAELVTLIRDKDPGRHVIVYSGRTFDELLQRGDVNVLRALAKIDVLVDGPYVADLDHDWMQYRGSSNQRVIDMRATASVPLHDLVAEGPVLLDWDTPEMIITEDGDLLGAVGLIESFPLAGEVCETRRCGEPVAVL